MSKISKLDKNEAGDLSVWVTRSYKIKKCKVAKFILNACIWGRVKIRNWLQKRLFILIKSLWNSQSLLQIVSSTFFWKGGKNINY